MAMESDRAGLKLARYLLSATAALSIAAAAAPTSADAEDGAPAANPVQAEAPSERPLLERWPEFLFDPDAFDGEEITEEARQAIEQLLAAVGPLMGQLQLVIQDLPRYDPPVILPNGDILIRRQRDDIAPPTADDRTNPDGSLDL